MRPTNMWNCEFHLKTNRAILLLAYSQCRVTSRDKSFSSIMEIWRQTQCRHYVFCANHVFAPSLEIAVFPIKSFSFRVARGNHMGRKWPSARTKDNFFLKNLSYGKAMRTKNNCIHWFIDLFVSKCMIANKRQVENHVSY